MRALASVRMDSKITQAELAARLGVDQTYVSKYETGRRRIDVIEFLRIVAALEVEPTRVLDKVWSRPPISSANPSE